MKSEYKKHIIWDWNGTLFDDVFLCMDIMNSILSRRNLNKLTVEEYRNVFTFPVKKYYQKIGHDLSGDNFERLSVEFISEYENRKYECKLYPDAVKHTLEEIVEYFGIRNFFVKLIGLDNIYAGGKMENGKRWIREIDCERNDVLLIGDTVHDYEVARELSIDCLLISCGHQSKDKLLPTGQKVLDSLSELFEELSF